MKGCSDFLASEQCEFFSSDAVAILLEFGHEGVPKQQKSATLILHNLCFHTSNKPKLLANGAHYQVINIVTITSYLRVTYKAVEAICYKREV